MHPFYFGSGRRRLFGIYEPSRLARSRSRAVLICHPWGAEYLHAHRSMKQLSGLLAAAGVDSLRFDYYGAGDSSGDDIDGDLSGWRQDIVTAAEEVMNLANTTRVTIVGLRLGATLAAQASIDLGQAASGLVLWDPIVDGQAYVDELYGTCRVQPLPIKEPVPRPANLGGGFEVLGFPLTGRMHTDLKGLFLPAIAEKIQCPVHAVVSGSEQASELARAALESIPALTVERIEALPVWLEDWPRNSGVVPVKILQQIVQWIAP